MKTARSANGQKQGSAMLAVFTALALAGCASQQEAWLSSDMPANYEARHPIEITSKTETATISVGVAGSGINAFEREQIASFGHMFRSDGEGALAIGIPVGSVNEKQAASSARTAREILVSQGLSAKAIVYRPYKANVGASAPPLLLSYRRIAAHVPSTCGAVDDLDYNKHNMQYQDFGCSTQNNFAAHLANPNDLMMPRPMDKASAARRSKVLEGYNESGNPPLTGGSATGGSGSSGEGAGSGS